MEGNCSALQEPQEKQVQSLGREDPLEKETATLPKILPWRIPWAAVHGVTESDTAEATWHTCTLSCALTLEACDV